jgi:hypothetical protein
MRPSRAEEFSAAQSPTEYRRSIVWQAVSCAHVPNYAVLNLCFVRNGTAVQLPNRASANESRAPGDAACYAALMFA